MEEHTKWSWVGILDIVTVPILLKFICRFNAIPIKLPAGCFADRQVDSKALMESKRNQKSQINCEKKNKVGGITSPHLKLIKLQ